MAEPPHPVLWFHPQRGTALGRAGERPRIRSYYGGYDTQWREVAVVRFTIVGGKWRVAAGQKLPRGFCLADPDRQRHGFGGPIYAYGPLELTCRDCRNPFTLSARAQKHMYEDLQLHIETRGVRCQPCGRARLRLEAKRQAYAAALHAADGATAAKPHLDAARATLELIRAGGRASLDRAIASCRRARRCGGGAAADRLEQALRDARASRTSGGGT